MSKRQKHQLSEDQEHALSVALNGDNVFITGSPGTGKSFLVNVIVDELRAQRKCVYLTAASAIAAVNIGGSTLHSFAGIQPFDESEEIVDCIHGARKYASDRWKLVDVLVIDEISMVSESLLFRVDYIARLLRGSPKLFGGVQVILVGDFYQLAPVTGRFCFFYEEWHRLSANTITLTTPFRQSDDIFIRGLENLRKGKLLPEFKAALRENPRERDDGVLPTHLCACVYEVDTINRKRMRALGNEIVSYTAVDTGENLDEWCNVQKRVDLCVGCQVMCIRNMPDIGVVNGSRGVVVSIENGFPVVKFMHSDVPISMTPVEFVVKKLGKEIGRRKMIPLRCAFAMTIHKSQGMTIDFLHVDVSSVFCAGQVYVALSRARSLEWLSVTGLDSNKLKPSASLIRLTSS